MGEAVNTPWCECEGESERLISLSLSQFPAEGADVDIGIAFEGTSVRMASPLTLPFALAFADKEETDLETFPLVCGKL